MRPPYINNKSQLENFGRLLFFVSEKTSIGGVWTFDRN